MIAKFLRANFGSATRYVLDRDPDLRHAGAHTLDTNMVGRDAPELTQEFQMVAAGNPRVQHQVAHIVLRPAPEDRQLDQREWTQIARGYLDRMGYTNTPYLVVRHPEPGQHVHVVASRVRYDGSRVNDHREHDHSRKVVREIERSHELRRTQPREHEREEPAHERFTGRGWERERER